MINYLRTDIDVLVNQILFEEPIISEARKPQLKQLIIKLLQKLDTKQEQKFTLFKVLKAHVLPLTNCAFNKAGDKFITGSYDRTCKVWNTLTGTELHTLNDHKNVVYTLAFNVPYGDKIVTGSFDRTAKLWETSTGKLSHTFKGHSMEIVCVSFDPQGELLATGSMDNTAKVWDIEKGVEIYTLTGHGAEIVSLNYNVDGDKILTASFDNTAKVSIEFKLDLGFKNGQGNSYTRGTYGRVILFTV